MQYDDHMMFSVESEFKYLLKEHVKAYFGLKYSMDGWMWLFGVKIAGLKFKIPVINIDHDHDTQLDDKYAVLKFLGVSLFFAGGSYLLKKLDDYIDKNRLQKWK